MAIDAAMHAMLQAMGDPQLQQFVGPRGRLEVAPPQAQAAGSTPSLENPAWKWRISLSMAMFDWENPWFSLAKIHQWWISHCVDD